MEKAGIFQRNVQWNFSLRKRWRAPFSVTFIRYCQLYFEIRWTDKLQIGVNDILVTRKSLLDLVGVVYTILVEGILIWEILLQSSLYLESATTFCNKIFSLVSKFVAFYLSFVIYSLAITKPTLQSCLCSTVHDEFDMKFSPFFSLMTSTNALGCCPQTQTKISQKYQTQKEWCDGMFSIWNSTWREMRDLKLKISRCEGTKWWLHTGTFVVEKHQDYRYE